MFCDLAPSETPTGAEVAEGAGSWLTFREVLLLLILAVVQFTHIVDFTIIIPLGPVFSKEMGLSTQQFGAVVGAYMITAGLSSLLAAHFLDRFDRKKALLLLYAGFISGTLLCSLAPTFYLLLAARAVAGAFGGVVNSLVYAIVGDAFPESKRGAAMGVVMSAFAVATFIGVPIGLVLSETYNWCSVFAVLGCVSVGVLTLAAVSLPPFRGHLEDMHLHSASAWDVLTDPNHMRAFAVTLALILASFILGPYLPTFLEYNVGVQPENIKYMYLCGGLAILLTMTLFGRLADRFGKLRVFRILAAISLVPTLLVTILPAGLMLPLVLTITTVFMMTASGRWVPAMALVTDCSAPAYRGSFMSFNSAIQQIAAGLASFVGGFILVEGENHTLSGFAIAGLLACAATMASIYLAGRLHTDPGGDLAPDSLAVAAPPAMVEAFTDLASPRVPTVPAVVRTANVGQ